MPWTEMSSMGGNRMIAGACLGRRDVDDPSERFETAAVRFSEACEEAIRAIEDFIALYSHPEIQAQEGKG